jgi:hypothetical protein
VSWEQPPLVFTAKCNSYFIIVLICQLPRSHRYHKIQYPSNISPDECPKQTSISMRLWICLVQVKSKTEFRTLDCLSFRYRAGGAKRINPTWLGCRQSHDYTAYTHTQEGMTGHVMSIYKCSRPFSLIKTSIWASCCCVALLCPFPIKFACARWAC